MNWNLNEIRIRQLWATADWGNETNELRKIFKSTLSRLNQVYLYDAITTTKEKYSSEMPQLAWIMKEYSAIEEARRIRTSGVTPPTNKYWVDFERPTSHNPKIKYSYSTDCPDLESAQQFAATVNGRIRNYAEPLPFQPKEISHNLSTAPRSVIAQAVAACRDRGTLSNQPLDPCPANWSKETQGIVMTEIQKGTP
jgi:hypothetical protein